ncbi:MAG: sodium/proton antiporter NhaB [Gammaproteobacteria bacterium CG22_combo_CG10-13_8_21_14_all_40_8]|nr:MAG: sodium/proton antiporter NhaB [Gammaproteobacteria bacterium CG22_combo_CG10-13_8_21_14_all_40_8]
MIESYPNAFIHNFLGHAPKWYKTTIVAFLIINPWIFFTMGGVIAGWLLIAEFIFTLAMALKCYPLQPGGLLAIEAIVIGMTSGSTLYHEVQTNLPVILLLMFMVAGIYFLQELLLFTFSRILLGIKSKPLLGLSFAVAGAFLSAFLDALTVTAVIIAVAVGFYAVYHKVASGKNFHDHEHDHTTDDTVHEENRQDLFQFRAFLRSLMMHALIGTALGGVTTLVGEPQNLLIAHQAGWAFKEFFLRMAPVTIPVLFSGLALTVILEITGWFGYGEKLPVRVRTVMEDFMAQEDAKRTSRQKLALIIQGIIAVWLIIALGFHLAEVGFIGLSVIVLATAFNGIIDEGQIGHAFEEALPFTALLVVFFAIVAVIGDQQLFTPVIQWVLQTPPEDQAPLFFIANGLLSSISDNVFVGTVYIQEALKAYHAGSITRDSFDLLAVAINTGTNIPSVATPNGQAAFLFLLTSAVAPLIRLSYGRMVLMALPYTVVMSLVGFFMVDMVLPTATEYMYEHKLINHHVPEDSNHVLTSPVKH